MLIETVGTGQSEVEVAAAADTTVVLEAPEMGDEVQAIKAGLLEVADLVVVNKGDKPGRAADRGAAPGDARPDGRPRRDADRPPGAEAAGGAGHDRVDRRGRPGAARRARPASGGRPRGPDRGCATGARRWPRSAASSPTGWRTGCASPALAPLAASIVDEVAEHRLDPYAAADRLLEAIARDDR